MPYDSVSVKAYARCATYRVAKFYSDAHGDDGSVRLCRSGLAVRIWRWLALYGIDQQFPSRLSTTAPWSRYGKPSSGAPTIWGFDVLSRLLSGAAQRWVVRFR